MTSKPDKQSDSQASKSTSKRTRVKKITVIELNPTSDTKKNVSCSTLIDLFYKSHAFVPESVG